MVELCTVLLKLKLNYSFYDFFFYNNKFIFLNVFSCMSWQSFLWHILGKWQVTLETLKSYLYRFKIFFVNLSFIKKLLPLKYTYKSWLPDVFDTLIASWREVSREADVVFGNPWGSYHPIWKYILLWLGCFWSTLKS